MGQALTTAAQQAFVESMALTTVVGAVIAFGGVLVAVLWMPHRPSDHADAVTAGSPGPVGLDAARDHRGGEQGGHGTGRDPQPDGAFQ